MKTTTTCLTAFLLLLAAFSASAENATRTGGYTIHHNALTTDSLPAQVATAYGLTRSKSRGLLNISVIRDEPGTMGTPVKAQIKAFARNLFGQMRTFDMREIIEDYVHSEGTKLAMLVLNTFFSVAIGAISVFALLKMAFGA